MKINNKDILLKFINSDLNEPDFFGLNTEDLISFKDYMINLKQRKQIYKKEVIDFKKEIKEITEMIKEKFPWVEDIEPSFRYPFKIILIAKKGYRDIHLSNNNENLWRPNGIAPYSFPIIDYLSNHYSKYMKVFWDSAKRIIDGKITKELNEINNIRDEMFKGKDRSFNYILLSASNRFRIFLYSYYVNCIHFINGPKDYDGMFIANFDDNLNIIENKERKSNKISITADETDELLKKVYVKEKNF